MERDRLKKYYNERIFGYGLPVFCELDEKQKKTLESSGGYSVFIFAEAWGRFWKQLMVSIRSSKALSVVFAIAAEKQNKKR